LEFLELKAKKRTGTGKGVARKLRQSGLIPAILYGKQMEPVMLSLPIKELDDVFRAHGRERLFFNVLVDGEETSRKALLKELQIHNVSGKFKHLDLHQIAMDQTLRIEVPLVTSGNSVGVEMGGLVQIIRRRLEVVCLPEKIPNNIEVDITELNIGESVHVSELKLPEGVTAPYDVDFTVVTVLQPKGYAEEEEEATDEEEGETAETEDSKKEPKEPKESKESKK